MKYKITTSLSLFFLFISFAGYSQRVKTKGASATATKGTATTTWMSNDKMPGNIPAFEENIGQFPQTAAGWKILYGCNYDGVEIYLTDKGIIYNVATGKKTANPGIEDEKDKNSHKDNLDGDLNQKVNIKYEHIFISWENAANAQVTGDDEKTYYFCEGKLQHRDETVTNIKGFGEVTYHNLYPGIDLVFSFHAGKGIEYALKVQPGADASVFKMKYKGDLGLTFDDSHNLHIKTIQGDIIDHAPVVTSGGTELPSSFQKTGNNEISFKIESATSGLSKGLLIDPWTTFPVSPAVYACDIGMDGASNTYVLEYSYPIADEMVEYVQKYSTTGSLVWTYKLNEFTTTPFNSTETDSAACIPLAFGDFAADQNGNTYICAPFGFDNGLVFPAFSLVELNTLGARDYINYTYDKDSIYETWNIAYSCADSILVESACYVCCDEAQFDGVNLTNGMPNPGEYVNVNLGEIYSATIAPNGLYYALSSTNNNSAPDQLLCCTVTKTSTALNWQTAITYTSYDAMFKETPDQVGDNGMAAGCAYLYTTDGLTLDQRSLTTGAIINTTTIPGGNNTTTNENSGVAVDLVCGNVYVGSNDIIYVYDENLSPIGSIRGMPGKVYDVRCHNGLISACGDSSNNQGFVFQTGTLPCSSGLTISHTNAGCSDVGTATATPTFCAGPYTYFWEPGGQTTQTITGLSAGQYTVTVSPAGTCFTVSDTVTVFGSGESVALSKDSICKGDSVTLTADSGSGYTFLWEPGGETTATIHVTISNTTTYTLITTGGSCPKDTTYITVKTINGITATAGPNDTICPGGTATLTVTGSGGIATYKWSNGATSSTTTVTGITQTTTYTATVYGVCDSVKKTETVVVEPPPTPVFTGNDWACKGLKDTIDVSGGCSYKWSNGSTKTSYTTGDINGDTTLIVTVKSCFGCAVQDTFKISPRSSPTVTVSSETVCEGGCVTLKANATGTPALTYKWNTGANTDTTTVCPDTTTTYNVTVSNGCPVNKTTKVTVIPASIYACCDTTIIKGDTAILIAGNSTKYIWIPATGLNCDTCPTVIATPTATTSYTITGTNSQGCTVSRVLTVIVETPCFNFKVPNVFTPDYAGPVGTNGGTNNVFYIETENITGWSCIIYDRWGKELFKTTDPTVFWDGNTEGGGKAPDGVYYYILSGTCGTNSYKKDGYLQLIR